MNGNEEEKFVYTYSAPTENERREIENIKSYYSGEKVKIDKLTRLRQIDSLVSRVPFIIAVIVGVLGCLVFGGGLTVTLELGNIAAGSVLSVLGCAVMVFAHILRKLLEKRNKKKYGAEIVRLSDELLKGTEN